MRERPNRAGEFSHAHSLRGLGEARAIAFVLAPPVGDLESKRGGLGVDAVGTSDGHGIAELVGASLQHLAETHDSSEDLGARFHWDHDVIPLSKPDPDLERMLEETL